MSKLLRLTEEDYLLLEDALNANPRGRAFLRMRDQRAQTVAADEVKRLVQGLADQLKDGGDGPGDRSDTTHIRILRQELQEMSVHIQQTRNEIAALRPDDTGNNRIMAATGELDAIVSATEQATSDILNHAESICALVAQLPRNDETKQVRDQLEAQATEILTACSFQDITGQRTSKVVNTLRYLEQRVNSMIEIWGVEAGAPLPVPNMVDTRPDAHLLNGPSSEGVSQDDVDSLLAGFGGDTAPAAEPSVAQPAAPPPAAPPPPAPAPVTSLRPTATATAPASAAPTKPAAPLMNGGANGTPINQNDIDALFD
jgi:chemotaxis regulatin CheY-phosphate phosphatase CheZ